MCTHDCEALRTHRYTSRAKRGSESRQPSFEAGGGAREKRLKRFSAEFRAEVLKEWEETREMLKSVFDSIDEDGNGTICQEELRAGFLKFSMLREAIVAVVTTLVKQKKWSPRQQQTA